MFGSMINSIAGTVENLIEDPIGAVIDITLQPIVDGCDLLDGLTEGEFRKKAALRLGADIAFGMAISELIEAMGE